MPLSELLDPWLWKIKISLIFKVFFFLGRSASQTFPHWWLLSRFCTVGWSKRLAWVTMTWIRFVFSHPILLILFPSFIFMVPFNSCFKLQLPSWVPHSLTLIWILFLPAWKWQFEVLFFYRECATGKAQVRLGLLVNGQRGGQIGSVFRTGEPGQVSSKLNSFDLKTKTRSPLTLSQGLAKGADTESGKAYLKSP